LEVEKKTVYFERCGEVNTEKVLEAVKNDAKKLE
jgi:hypothetical protein